MNRWRMDGQKKRQTGQKVGRRIGKYRIKTYEYVDDDSEGKKTEGEKKESGNHKN